MARPYKLELTDSGLRIQCDDPDVDHVVELDSGDPMVQRLKALTLHHADLALSLEYLEALKNVQPFVIARAVWEAAIVRFFKCYGDNDARFSLVEKKVFQNEPEAALEVFRYFRDDIRNRNLVHDVNSYTQCKPMAFVRRPDVTPSVFDTVCMVVDSASMLDSEHIAQFSRLVSHSLQWVDGQIEAVSKRITAALNLKSNAEIRLMPQPCFRKETLDSAPRPR
jgi:hypothetical protein